MDTQSSSARINQQILDNLNSAVLLFDEALVLQYLNPAAEALLAISRQHILGLGAAEVLKCHSDQGSSRLQYAIDTGSTITEREMTLSLPGLRKIMVDCTVIPLTDREGGTGVLVEMQQIERQLRISQEEHLLSQHQAARELVRGLAHEIKNPLGGLRGSAQLLERELGDPALCEYTQIIIDEADRLQGLVNRMLGPNRLPELEQVDLHRLLERVRNLVVVESGEQLQIDRDYDPSIPEVTVDADSIIQALLNIVRNAARAVGGREDGRILLKTRICRQFTIGNHFHRLVAQIGIHDNGPGIPEKIRANLFYPMVTASEGGMGLGLSIAQSLINQHGGLVECTSEPGDTVFNVLIPLENPNAEN